MKHILGVVGVGLMGRPIAENLKNKGFEVYAYDLNKQTLKELEEEGIKSTENPKELIEKVDVLLDVLNDTNHFRDVLDEENGILKGINGRKIVIDMTTSDPEKSKPIGAELKEYGVEYLDCPMTGGRVGARNGELIIMAGGDKKVFEEVRYILDAISKELVYLGGMGSGHYMKLIHNQLSHSTFLASCEAFNLGRELGIDEEAMIKVFNVGNARSYATEVRFPKFILSGTYDAGASFYTVGKDISLIAKKANELNYDLPITRATFDYWRYAIETGNGDEDYSKIVNLMVKKHNDRNPK